MTNFNTDEVELYQIILPYATFGILVDKNTLYVVKAPPIAMWMTGQKLEDITTWVEKKHGTINFF